MCVCVHTIPGLVVTPPHLHCLQNPAKAKVTRKFIVAEGLYANYGDLAPLAPMVSGKHLSHVCQLW